MSEELRKLYPAKNWVEIEEEFATRSKASLLAIEDFNDFTDDLFFAYAFFKIKALRAKVKLCDDEKCPSAKQADVYAKINQAVSAALGQEFGASWHDLGVKVAALKIELEAERKISGAIKSIACREREWRLELSPDMGSDEIQESVYKLECEIEALTTTDKE